jgi:hypothetical protein
VLIRGAQPPRLHWSAPSPTRSQPSLRSLIR